MNDRNIFELQQRRSERGKEKQSPFYKMLRQQGATAPMIIFSLRNGRKHALPTSSLIFMDFEGNHNDYLSIRFRNAKVEIDGRNLNELFEFLATNKIEEIREVIHSPDNRAFDIEKDLFIKTIHFSSDLLEDTGS